MNSSTRRRKARNLRLLALGLFLLASGGVIWATAKTSYSFFESDLKTRVLAALEVQTGLLESHLEKFRVLAPIVAQSSNAEAVALFQDEQVGKQVSAIAAGMAGAEEVWFLSTLGQPIASSLSVEQSWSRFGSSGIPKAFSEAAQGQLGRELLVGSPNHPSSYVFATPVRVNNRLVGILAVRVPLAPVEQAWALTRYPLAAIDETGRIVVTNVASLRGKDLSAIKQVSELHIAKSLPVLGWQVHVYAAPVEAHRQSLRAVVIAALLCVILGGILWALIARSEGQALRRRRQKASALRLERKVQHRTAALRHANSQLRREVEDRQKAEGDLRQAQAELIQAAKLATLGRMSASLSHEYNQPLAAIRSDADVAEMLIARGRSEEAVSNLKRIVVMVDRMAEIARTLKGFTRKAGTDVRPVQLQEVVEEAVLLVRPHVVRTGTDLVVLVPEEKLMVAGGKIRLEQVLVNLLSNAVDAVAARPAPKIILQVRKHENWALVSVEDNGGGIAEDIRDQIFEPFFATKEAGSGLGLGLSIAYKIIHDFNGTLDVEDRPGGGARFVMRLPLRDNPSLAVE